MLSLSNIASISVILLSIEQYALSSSAFAVGGGIISRSERIQFPEQLQLKKKVVTQLHQSVQPINAVNKKRDTFWKKKVSNGNPKNNNNNGNSLVTTISSEKEYHDFLKQNENSLCIIKFHAAWCKSCQKFGMRYNELAVKENKNSEGDVCFAQIEFGSNRQLCKSLGIKRLPTMHFHKFGEKIDGFPCGPSKFHILLDTLGRYKNISTIDEMLAEKTLHDDGNTLVKSKEVSKQVFYTPSDTLETKEGGESSNHDDGNNQVSSQHKETAGASTKTVDELLDQLSGMLSN